MAGAASSPASCSAKPTSTGRTGAAAGGARRRGLYIFDALGIDPHKQLTAPDGRPIEILDKGEVVKRTVH